MNYAKKSNRRWPLALLLIVLVSGWACSHRATLSTLPNTITVTKIEPPRCESLPPDPPPLTTLNVWPGGPDVVSMDGMSWNQLALAYDDAIKLISALRRCVFVERTKNP